MHRTRFVSQRLGPRHLQRLPTLQAQHSSNSSKDQYVAAGALKQTPECAAVGQQPCSSLCQQLCTVHASRAQMGRISTFPGCLKPPRCLGGKERLADDQQRSLDSVERTGGKRVPTMRPKQLI